MTIDIGQISAADFVGLLILNTISLTLATFALVLGSLGGYRAYRVLVNKFFPQESRSLSEIAHRFLYRDITPTEQVSKASTNENKQDDIDLSKIVHTFLSGYKDVTNALSTTTNEQQQVTPTNEKKQDDIDLNKVVLDLSKLFNVPVDQHVDRSVD